MTRGVPRLFPAVAARDALTPAAAAATAPASGYPPNRWERGVSWLPYLLAATGAHGFEGGDFADVAVGAEEGAFDIVVDGAGPVAAGGGLPEGGGGQGEQVVAQGGGGLVEVGQQVGGGEGR